MAFPMLADTDNEGVEVELTKLILKLFNHVIQL